MKEQRVYEALARGETAQGILPLLLQDLQADALVLFYLGESEAWVSFSNASLGELEAMKESLLAQISSEGNLSHPLSADAIQLTLSESQLMLLKSGSSDGPYEVHLLTFQDELLGGIALFRKKASTPETNLDELLAALGFARRIETSRRLNEEALHRLDRLAEAGGVFSQTLSLDRTLVKLLEIAVDIAGTGAGIFIVKDHPDSPSNAPLGWGMPVEWINEVCLINGEVLLDHVLREGRPVYFEELEGLAGSTIPKFLESLVVLPLCYEGGTLGCLCIPNAPSRFFESEAEIRALLALASLAGGAIRNAQHLSAEIRAERLREEMRIAADVQKTLLPRELPKSEDLEAAAMMRPALHLGGDFYDILPLGEGKWILMIADISGKGTSAALLMATARAYLHALASEGLQPAELLCRMNDNLISDFSEGRFLTGMCLLLDLKERKIHSASGGHHPAFLIKPSGKIECIGCDDLPLGLVSQDRFSQETRDLQPGTAILLYTDGLVEAKSPDGKFFGSENMYPVLTRLAHNTAQEIIDGLVKDVLDWAGDEPLPDDLTILAVRVK